MAIAAIAHIFVFSTKPYRIVPPSHYTKVTTQETKAVLKVKEGDEENPALVEKKETEVRAPGTSVKESVQDIVMEGGQKVRSSVSHQNSLNFSCWFVYVYMWNYDYRKSCSLNFQSIIYELQVVEDVVLTINQAIEPVHEGMTKIQEQIHKITVSGNGKEEKGVKVLEEHRRDVTKEPQV